VSGCAGMLNDHLTANALQNTSMKKMWK